MKWIIDKIRGVFNRILSFTPLGIVQRFQGLLVHWQIILGGLLFAIAIVVGVVAFLLPQKPAIKATPTPTKTATVRPMVTGTPQPGVTPTLERTPTPTKPVTPTWLTKNWKTIQKFFKDPRAPFKDEFRNPSLWFVFTVFVVASLLESSSRLDLYDFAWLVGAAIILASIKSPFLQTREAAWAVTLIPLVIGIFLSISGGPQGPDFSPLQDVLTSTAVLCRIYKSLGGLNLALGFKPGQWFPFANAITVAMNNAKLKDWMLFLSFVVIIIAWLTIIAEKKSAVGMVILTIGVGMLSVPFLVIVNELLKGTAVWMSVFCYLLLFFAFFIGIGELSRMKKAWAGLAINLLSFGTTILFFLFLPETHWLVYFLSGLIMCMLFSFLSMGRIYQSGEAVKGKKFWQLLTFPWEIVKWFLTGILALLMAAP